VGYNEKQVVKIKSVKNIDTYNILIQLNEALLGVCAHPHEIGIKNLQSLKLQKQALEAEGVKPSRVFSYVGSRSKRIKYFTS